MSIGTAQALTGLSAGNNYVLRVPLAYDFSSRAQPRIFVRDVTNDAYITWLDGPWLNGTHDGGDGSAALSDTAAPYWPTSLVGATVYNITDGSSVVITAAGESIVGALAGGTDDDWDDDDEYRIVPASTWKWVETFTLELPTIARNGAVADCVAAEWGVLNLSDGEVFVHQIEVQGNEIDGTSLETWSGADPDIPDGWTNVDLDAGDLENSAGGGAIIHSGVDAAQFNAGAINEGISAGSITGVGVGTFFVLGGWEYGDTGGSLSIGPTGANGVLQYATTASGTRYITWPNTDAWKHAVGVERSLAVNPTITVVASAGGTGSRFLDDIYMFSLDPVTLTVTPSSEVNATEASGLRVSGMSTLVQPVPVAELGATSGIIRLNWTPRHSAGDFEKFGNLDPVICVVWNSGTDYISLQCETNDNIRLTVVVAGVATTNDWVATGLIVAGTTYLIEILYDATQITALFDTIIRNIAVPGAGIDFGVNIPTTAYWGHEPTGTLQVDSTYSSP